VLENKKIIIAGGGHAGIEAAFAISRMGGWCTLVTMERAAIGRLSCNPAMGGLGKSHLVKEIDALGGIMGRCSDSAGLQFKTLNKTKGRAVWALRAQIDKKEYPKYIKCLFDKTPKIEVVEGEVVSFNTQKEAVSSVVLKDGRELFCSAFLVTCGTFLNGLIHIGASSFSAGRLGERPALGLTECLQKHGLKTGRLKTGTPPRLNKQSINWALTKKALGDSRPTPFSLFTERPFFKKQEDCYVIKTNQHVHNVIHKNIGLSAMFSGKITGVGPRYCPSIEDKIYRFQDNPSHLLFLEPEWKNSNQIYLNGFSTSLPEAVQKEALRSIPALENVSFIRPGYAIEYDYSPPYQLTATLMSKSIKGLFFAGQINGTSGYEEAAAQGLVAGANALLYVKKSPPLLLSREDSYIGVMIDDLITSHLDEPYRMFTSRAEHRLYLRADNCYERLFCIAKKHSLLTNSQQEAYRLFFESLKTISLWIKGFKFKTKNKTVLGQKHIKRPEVSLFDLLPKKYAKLPFFPEAAFTAETAIKYEGYIENERQRMIAVQKLEALLIPQHFDYNKLQGLSNESKSRLVKIRPQTLGQASRISGIRPTDITLIGLSIKVSRETA
jgi:tRNA uridine 5-carboxymethylaminomethyl modification enzyme